MDNFEYIISAGFCFLTGAFVGAFLMHRGFRPKSRQHIEAQLDECQKQLRQYKTQMSDYFSHASNLVENLNITCRDLQNHLVTSAEQINSVEASSSLLALAQKNISNMQSKSGAVIQPLDYAPKKGGLGTLNEEYGLKDDQPSKPPSGEAYTDLS